MHRRVISEKTTTTLGNRDEIPEGSKPAGRSPAEQYSRWPGVRELPDHVLSAKFGAPYVAQDLSSVLEERCPRRGKANRPLTPLKKWHTEFDFQVPDLHAQRRLRYVKLLRGPAEVPFLRDAHKISQAAKVHDADYMQNV